jgi:hypothetical protein
MAGRTSRRGRHNEYAPTRYGRRPRSCIASDRRVADARLLDENIWLASERPPMRA